MRRCVFCSFMGFVNPLRRGHFAQGKCITTTQGQSHHLGTRRMRSSSSSYDDALGLYSSIRRVFLPIWRKICPKNWPKSGGSSVFQSPFWVKSRFLIRKFFLGRNINEYFSILAKKCNVFHMYSEYKWMKYSAFFIIKGQICYMMCAFTFA